MINRPASSGTKACSALAARWCSGAAAAAAADDSASGRLSLLRCIAANTKYPRAQECTTHALIFATPAFVHLELIEPCLSTGCAAIAEAAVDDDSASEHLSTIPLGWHAAALLHRCKHTMHRIYTRTALCHTSICARGIDRALLCLSSGSAVAAAAAGDDSASEHLSMIPLGWHAAALCIAANKHNTQRRVSQPARAKPLVTPNSHAFHQ